MAFTSWRRAARDPHRDESASLAVLHMFEGREMNALYWTIRNFIECPREEGQTMAEYALILVLIAIVVIIALGPLGDRIAAIFVEITEGLTP
jgi:Flp pilus assembly pilin Flp